MLPMIRRAADDSLMVTELYISHLCTEKNTSHVFTEIIRPSHKNIDYNCCLADRSVQHIFIPYDTIIRLFKPRLAARCMIQAQNSVCNKVCVGINIITCILQRVKLRHIFMLIFNAIFLMFVFRLIYLK